MSNFDQAHIFTAKWEGGFVNNPKDPGGATNYGVSLRWLKSEGLDFDFVLPFKVDHNNDGVIDILDIKALTASQAATLFQIAFWNRLNLASLPPATAIVTYDAAVNVGRGQAAKFLQQACNTFVGDQLVVDGGIGPKTRGRAQALAGQDCTIATRCIDFREAFHKMLASSSPYPDGRDYRSFLRGWLNRTADLRKYVADNLKKSV
jgi:lysozyme family protein